MDMALGHPNQLRSLPMLVMALEAFFGEHRRCGALDTGVDDGRVWVTCECGAVVVQPLRSTAGGRINADPGATRLPGAG
jgi:hypothetical protein